jgi:hypothetical protein
VDFKGVGTGSQTDTAALRTSWPKRVSLSPHPLSNVISLFLSQLRTFLWAQKGVELSYTGKAIMNNREEGERVCKKEGGRDCSVLENSTKNTVQ